MYKYNFFGYCKGKALFYDKSVNPISLEASPMNQFNKDLMAALAQKQDLNETFHQYLEQAINELLLHELATFLGYEPYGRQGFNSSNLRNGSYQRTFKTQYGYLNLTIPRCLLHTSNNLQFHQSD